MSIYYREITKFTYLKIGYGFCTETVRKYNDKNKHEYYSIICNNYKTTTCIIEGDKIKFHIRNGMSHSFETNAYASYITNLYFIDGCIISKNDWLNHHEVIKKLRLKKLNKIFFDI